ncbi:MAG: alpha-isopropylmalate synthase regulatory domain-containing protein, partial [Planctomycetia bacterium]|nr:alpha-isopropylmalate synthase regulatory domain-containing protein [Planctomycetia bacterium]
SGAVLVQGAVNGFGVRCGNADLTVVIPNLVLKMNLPAIAKKNLKKLTMVSRYVYETANMLLVDNQPFVGRSAFAHKGGLHVAAVSRDERTYEHVNPDLVGNSRRLLVGELSGHSTIAAKAAKLALTDDRALLRKVLKQMLKLEHEGYQFEAAEASFELLLRKAAGLHKTFFELDHYYISISKDNQGTPVTEATIKLRVAGHTEHTAADGDGPVNALDAALRKALMPHYPALEEMSLTDYKVRVINSGAGTAARVRVVIELKDASERWGTVGVSENIIDASWAALVDGIEYKLLKDMDTKRGRKKN